uniref:Major centromere autoantigen B-like n=1 Tax=Petromyzon marinus TaxID=7757 RepID=A0AAJ7SKS2_PETMA|nr:major centromere autoantigen B-like [Petromyzon marinus]
MSRRRGADEPRGHPAAATEGVEVESPSLPMEPLVKREEEEPGGEMWPPVKAEREDAGGPQASPSASPSPDHREPLRIIKVKPEELEVRGWGTADPADPADPNGWGPDARGHAAAGWGPDARGHAPAVTRHREETRRPRGGRAGDVAEIEVEVEEEERGRPRPPRPRAKRVFLSLGQKMEVLRAMASPGGRPLQSIAADFNVGYTTVRDIRDSAPKIARLFGELQGTGAARRRVAGGRGAAAPSEAVDRELHAWLLERLARGHPVSGPMLCHKARALHQRLRAAAAVVAGGGGGGGGGASEEPFVANQGWLRSFKERHGVRRLSAAAGDGAPGADAEAAGAYAARFRALVEARGLGPSQVYDADETGLLWKAPPPKVLARRGSGAGGRKGRLALLACANASGTHRLRLACVGESRRPRAPRDAAAAPPPPVRYYGRRGARLDGATLGRWFFGRFVPEVRRRLRRRGLPERALLLLLDDGRAGRAPLRTADGAFAAELLPPGVAPPMRRGGALALLKRRYRRDLLGKLRAAAAAAVAGDGGRGGDPRDVAGRFWGGLTVGDALVGVAAAWRSLRSDGLRRCWRALWPDGFHDPPAPPAAAAASEARGGGDGGGDVRDDYGGDVRDDYSGDVIDGGGDDYGGDVRDDDGDVIDGGGDVRDSGGDVRDDYGGDVRDGGGDDYSGDVRDDYGGDVRDGGGDDYSGDVRDDYDGGDDYGGDRSQAAELGRLALECLELLRAVPGCDGASLEDVTDWLSSRDSSVRAWHERTDDEDEDEEDEEDEDEEALTDGGHGGPAAAWRRVAATRACDTLLDYLDKDPLPELEQRKLLLQIMRNEIQQTPSAANGV